MDTSKNKKKKKKLTNEDKKRFILAGGSLKTQNKIDAQEILREVKGK